MSLSRCIKKLGVSAHEAAIYKAVFDDYRNDGIEPMLAARKAVQERLDELLGERANVIKQIGEAIRPTIPKPGRKLSPEEAKVSAIYADVLANGGPAVGISAEVWFDQMAEQVVKPSRYHEIKEDENPKGLKIGDVVAVTKPGWEKGEARVTSIVGNAPKAYPGGFMVHTQTRDGFGGWAGIDHIEKARKDGDAAPSIELKSQTADELAAAAKAADDKAKADAKAKAAADEKEKQDRIKKEVAQRSEGAADTFQLGAQVNNASEQKKIDAKAAEDNLAGQGDIFGNAPETVAPQGSPSTAKPAGPEELKAKADLMAGLADLADIFGKNTKLYLTPEQEQKLLPVLTKIFDAAFRLGHVKFKAAAKYVLDQIRAMLGDDVAKAINLDHLQGAYISMASGKQGADTKRAVIDVETLAEIDAPAVDPVVAKYPSVEGTEIHVVKNQQGHAVSMFDTDTGEYLPTLRMFKGDDSLEQAKMYAADLQAKSGVENGGEQAQNAPKEPGNAPNRDTNLERDSGNAAAAGDAVGKPDGAGRQGADKGARQPGRKPGLAGSAGQGDSLVSNGGATPPRKRGDIPVYPGETESLFADLPPGIDESERGDPVGQPGVRTDAGRAGAAGVATRPAEQADKRRAQLDARGVKIIPADAGNIAESLPYLKDGQRDDVAFAERRFAKPDGHGVLYTNGTGTGKTYTGLGIAYRFERQGKSNIAIIAPQDKVIEDWIASGKNLGLDIKKLDGTKDNGGSGIVITTYENFSQNDALAHRKWDLVLADESHKLMQNAAGDETGFIEAFRALTMHPRGASDLAVRKYRKEYDASKQADADYIAARKAKSPDTPRLERISEEKSRAWTAKLKLVQEEVAAAQKGGRSKAVFLSATPWAYEKNVDYAEGYLFDYPEVDSGAYNSGGGFERFMMTHFGYRMRYNKLTEPGPEVDRGLMQRQFNTWLKREGALSGRSLDVPFDYDRKFVLIDSSIGRRIDEALEWFWQRDGLSQAESRARGALYDKVKEHFDYLHRRFLLEALKAEAVVPLIKQNLELGRKVVVFHDYKKGGGFHPFHTSIAKGEEVGYYDPSAKGEQPKAMLQPVWDQFKTEFADLMAHPFHRMKSPIEAIKTAFPDAGIFNGDVPKKARIDAVNRFQADDSPYNVVLIQSAAGKEGISAHDTTGKHQRVLYNLGLPTQPTTAIQQEGRIFRTGQASNAMMRYLNTGTSWERDAFANTISRRASTAENLAMGEGARGLLDSFINAFESSDTYPPGHEGEGTGGKEMDRALQQALSEFDRAKTFYFGQQKKTSRTKAQEGADYFATPEPLALKMVEWASVQKGDSVLEPSAGHGAIARWFPDNVKRRAIEPSGELASRLALVFDGEIERGSFEEHHIVNKYDAIVMNPPFGSSSKTAFDHIEKAWQHLREGGRLVALFPQGPAADKRLDKFLNEGVKKEAKLLFTHATLGPINRGDTAIIDAFGRQQKMVVWDVHQKTPTGAAYVMPKGADLSSAINLVAVTRIERPDTQAKDLPQKVAEILLPSVTFERAGTSVAARVLVVQKGGFDEQPISRDYRDIDTIKEFFDRIEHFDLTARAERAEPEAPAPAKTAKAAPDAKPAGTTPAGGLFESFEQKHSRTGETMYMAGYAKRVSTEDYRAADSVARKHGGHYSRYENKAQGIKKGFAFPDAEKRQAFLNEAGQSQGGNAGDAPVFSRRKIDSTNPLIQAWNDIAQSDDAFRYGETEAKGLPEIVAAVDPALKVQESKEHSSAVERMFYITEKGGGGVILKDYGDKVELDASPLKQGQGGNRFYHIAAMYALNNGKVFDGDRVGVSAIAVRRRVENLLSSALRFGTTRHLSPGPEVETGTVSEDFGEKRRLPVRALSWKPGDDAHNLHELLITSMENVQKAVPQIKDVRYNFSNRTFENADGTEFTDADFDALASSGDARAASAGRSTLKRAVLSQSVLQGARRQGSGLLDAPGKRNAAAADPLGRALEQILYKRTQAPLLAGLSVSGAQNHVAGYKWKNGPAINVLANPADAPFAAPADAVGAFWGGKVWVFASNVSNTAELNFAVFHEALGHYGLRGAFGASRALDNALQHLWVANRKVRAETSKWTQRYGKDALKARLDSGMTENEAKRTVHFLAIEEALADRAAAGDTFKGIQKLMAALQDALRAVGLDTVADWLEGMSNAEASRTLDIARQFVEKGATNIATVERLAAVYQRKEMQGLPLFGRMADQLKGMNKGAADGLFKGEPALDDGSQSKIDAVARHTIQVAQDEILKDIKSGAVPKTVKTFSELHDYVDANMYVNDADRKDRRIGPLGKSLGWGVQDYTAFTNRAIEALDAWLADGRKGDATARLGDEAPMFSRKDRLDDIGGGNLLTAYDDAELKAKTDREAAAAKAEAEAAKAPASKKVTAHQDSLFEGQIALFSRRIEKGQESLARRVINRVDAALDPIGSLPGHKEYLAERYRTLGRLARVDDIAKEIHKAFGSASDADAAAAYDYLTTADADPTTIRDEEVRAGAVRVKNLLGSIGDALVQRGMLSEESREEYRDRYLPRLYLKHLLGDSVFSALAGGKKPSDMGYLKARKDIPEDVRKVILGEIEDPGFLSAIGVAKPMRDMALLDWLARMSRNQDWVYPQSLVEYKNAPATVRFLLAEALRLRQQAAHMKPELAERARQEADAMEAAANSGDDNDPPNPADYKRIPDTARYGRMRGLWVRKEIYDDLMGVHDFLPTDPGWFQSVFGYGGIGTKVTQLWKMSKVALNPPGQVRNFVSNAVMLQLSGVPLLRLPDLMIRAGLEIVRNGEAFQTAKRYGVTAASFSSQEMGRIETELLRVQAQKGFHPLRRIRLVFGAIANGAGDLYQFTESMFKTAKIMHELENGRDEAAAALEAHKWMFDYSLVPKSVRYARNAPIGVPFITYVYKVLPRLLEVAMFHPHRFLPWVALAYGLPAMAAASFGVGGDDLEKLKKALPEWLQKRGFAYFLPFKDDGGRMQAVDLGYFFPWSQWTEIAHSFARGNVNDAMQSAGLFSGPITDILVAVKTGIDPFTKRPIMNKADPAERQALDLLNYVYNMAAPPFITSNGVLSPMGLIDPMYGGKAVQAATGTTNRFGDPRATGQQAALALLGVNMYAIDPEHARAQNVMRMQRELQDVEGRAKQLLTDRGLTAERKAEIVKDYTAESKRRAQELAKYLRESQVHPNLRRSQ